MQPIRIFEHTKLPYGLCRGKERPFGFRRRGRV